MYLEFQKYNEMKPKNLFLEHHTNSKSIGSTCNKVLFYDEKIKMKRFMFKSRNSFQNALLYL